MTTTTENELLRLIKSETTRVESLALARGVSQAARDLRAGLGVRICPDWIGHDGASRQARCRALRSLEDLGVVVTCAVYSARLSHVRLVGRPLPPPPVPPPVVEHQKSMVQQRREKAEAWVASCQQARREAAQ